MRFCLRIAARRAARRRACPRVASGNAHAPHVPAAPASGILNTAAHSTGSATKCIQREAVAPEVVRRAYTATRNSLGRVKLLELHRQQLCAPCCGRRRRRSATTASTCRECRPDSNCTRTECAMLEARSRDGRSAPARWLAPLRSTSSWIGVSRCALRGAGGRIRLSRPASSPRSNSATTDCRRRLRTRHVRACRPPC